MIYCTISFIRNFQNGKIYKDREWINDCLGVGGWGGRGQGKWGATDDG